MEVDSRKRAPDGSVGEWLDYLAPSLWRAASCPSWPPDLFALAGAVIEQSGAYFQLVQLSFQRPEALLGADWPSRARDLAKEWRLSLDEAAKADAHALDDSIRSAPRPRQLDEWWTTVRANGDRLIGDVHTDENLCRALLSLLATADQASKGMGIRVDERVLEFAQLRVLARHKSRSLCLDVSSAKLRVLPKQHTSQRGITLRSLSHNLALQFSVSVQAEWITPASLASGSRLDLLNLLLLPWPESIDRSRFRVARADEGAPDLPGRYRFFRMTPTQENGDTFRQRLDAAVVEAKACVDRLHGIVFPELALSLDQYLIAEEIAAREALLLIAGVWIERGECLGTFSDAPTNLCVVQPSGLVSPHNKKPELTRLVRAKNHRWCLNGPQIRSYGLEGRIPSSKDCWELTALHPRSITFLTLGPWMTLCVQICEDLARQDEVASLIRSIGPNLVVALLMDAPQLSSRWPSRYASILADDPGSSVLTLTSLGMTGISTPSPNRPNRSRVIALWRDIEQGEKEIELEEGQNACVIHLVCQSGEEFAADGRGDGGVAHFPILAAYRGLTIKI